MVGGEGERGKVMSTRAQGHFTRIALAVVFAVLVVLVARGCVSGAGDTGYLESQAHKAESAPPPDQLEMVSTDWHWSWEYDWATAEGRVKNISDRPLDHVIARVEWETRGGQFITSGESLTDYQPILPGQTSPWKVMATWNPEMAKGRASVHFSYLMGGSIPTRIVDPPPKTKKTKKHRH
jgi:hypothetical protein